MNFMANVSMPLALLPETRASMQGYLDLGWRVGLFLLIALPLLYLVSGAAHALLRKRLGEHRSVVLRKVIFFLGLTAIAFVTLHHQLGLNLTTFLGAAGIASIAIGFAAQTSLSNVISGVFLYWEKPFELGDIVRVGTTTGVVMAIDLMSVKLRTFDNQFVRLPNETMVKAEVTTISKFPVRRMDLPLVVDFDADPDRVVKILEEIAAENAFALDQPKPLILLREFSESGLQILYGVWFEKTQFIETRNSLMREIRQRFRAEKIAFGWPHRHLSWPDDAFLAHAAENAREAEAPGGKNGDR